MTEAWIEHDGSCTPVESTDLLEIEMADGTVTRGRASDFTDLEGFGLVNAFEFDGYDIRRHPDMCIIRYRKVGVAA